MCRLQEECKRAVLKTEVHSMSPPYHNTYQSVSPTDCNNTFPSPFRHRRGSLSNRICREEAETTLTPLSAPVIEGVSAG